MYSKQDLLNKLMCSEAELQQLLKQTGLDKEFFDEGDLRSLEALKQLDQHKMEKIALLLVAFATVLVIGIFVITYIAVQGINPL